jgi:hypothetical protein
MAFLMKSEEKQLSIASITLTLYTLSQ